MPTLIKSSPLAAVYRRYPVQTVLDSGWQIAEHFGQLQRERQQLVSGAVLADWSHLSKLSVSGREAARYLESLLPGAGTMAPLSGRVAGSIVILRLTVNDYLLLCQAAQNTQLLPSEPDAVLGTLYRAVNIIDHSGALGCFVLAGPRRDNVLERSTAVDLRRDRVAAGAVLQTSIHTVRCTLYRTEALEVILHPRSLSESLFDALMDVGVGVGLMPTGLATLPVAELTCHC
ncbi:MAG TPA: hypothetical protein V6D06_00615 [Trichocoleus sp.]